ncbi:putative Co/Zn/Cd cation transporter [Acidobacteriia bacterium SbA2]|nr:putative Co/Zn/Cd cation transporter [Acidobacteriia bacterium SbA2]
MESVLPVPTNATLYRIRRIQAITIAWMSAETVVSLSAAWMAHSPALLAFGGDSAIELLSAVVVYWRFRSKWNGDQTERLAARITGCLLFTLGAFVALVAALALLGHREVRPSLLGIAVLSVAAVGMPLLARQKRRLSALTASAALRADAAESALCGYLSIIALGGLVANAFWGITWADPVAALCLLPLIGREGGQALKGRPCDCC